MTEPKKGASDSTEPIVIRRPAPADKGEAAETSAAPSEPVASPEATAAAEAPDSTPDQPTSMPSDLPADARSEPAEVEAPAPAPTSGQVSDAAPGKGGADIRRAGRPKHLDKPRDDFASLLARQGPRQTVEQGTIVKGELVAISKPWVFVDLGAKTEGVLALEEILDEDGNPQFGIGDQIEAFVASTRRGEIRLSRRLGKAIRDQEMLFDAFENGVPVEGRVKATNKGGFEVTLAGRRAFCPISQIDLEYTEEPGVHVGNTYRFRIVEMSPDGKRLVVSRAALLREERKRQREELIDHLVPGIDVDGVVTSIQEYGAFVDLGGLEGLVHISELSWGRVEHPSEVVKEGQEVAVRVLDMKETDKGLRISLSLRQTAPHPWVAVGTKFVEGESYPGKVTRLEPYGAFVELGPGLEGLVHISEITWDRRLKHPKEVLSLGQPVDVYIKSIDYDRERLSLSLKALEKDPWADADQRYPTGSTVKGEVEKVQPFGIFVRVEPGLTALIPASESGTGSGEDLRRTFSSGQEIAATVLNVEPERRRMSLSLKAAHEAKETADLKRYMEKQEDTEKKGSFGTLGDLFGDKLRR